MRRFAQLFRTLDESNRTSDKVQALVDFFGASEAVDAAWAIALLSGKRPRRPVNYNLMVAWACEQSGIPEWLFAECYEAAGDMGETLSLILPEAEETGDASRDLAYWMETLILPLREMEVPEQKQAITVAWAQLDQMERFVFNKLVGGSFRVGVSDKLLVQGLSKLSGLPAAVLAGRLMGNWEPSAAFFTNLISKEANESDLSRPYPFCLAYPLEDEPAALGNATEWSAEWKWDGIRAQLIKRKGETWLWSRGEELMTERFPEIIAASEKLPDGMVLDGEILAWQDEAPLPFLNLQKRIGRKSPSKKLMQDVPVLFMAYDCLEINYLDIRSETFAKRRSLLLAALEKDESNTLFRISPAIDFEDWDALASTRSQSREQNAEGLMLKRKASLYHHGRKRGDWWKWKIEPYTVDAVLVYAQRGTGRRAGLYTDYTFAVWDGEALVPFAKAYSGLTDEEIRKVDAFVRANTLERFGPVRTVKPELVFELAFEGLQESSRHKSGIAVRFPRISRWRTDKKPKDADTLEGVKMLLRKE